ncbi:MAG: tetratricopeptide repeat protein [bacterium]|nr:tetratricopeptide repeat protein [bacterium]
MSAELDRARELSRIGRHEEAAAAALGHLEQEPEDVHALNLLAYSQGELGDVESALATSARAIAIDPEEPWSYHMHASCVCRTGDIDKAETSIDRAIALDPDDPDHYEFKARMQLTQDRPKAALATLDVALALDPESDDLRLVRVDVLRDMGRDREADELIDEALALAPDSAEIHGRAAATALRRGDAALATELYLSRLRSDPEDDEARRGLLEAIRAGSRMYRPFLWLRLELGRVLRRLSVPVTFGVTIAIIVLSRSLGLSPILLVAILVIPTTLADLLVLCHPIGRHALLKHQRVVALVAGVELVGALVAGVGWLFQRSELLLACAIAAVQSAGVVAVVGWVGATVGAEERTRLRMMLVGLLVLLLAVLPWGKVIL